MQIKRETGENPVRSRHCEREQEALMSLRHVLGKALPIVELESGELLILNLSFSYGVYEC